jgi:hypothetical protein
MSEEFRIKETIDANGHRVIVYEFFGSEARGRTRRKKKNDGRASFIKVTFEGGGASAGEEIPEVRRTADADLIVRRRGLGKGNPRT